MQDDTVFEGVAVAIRATKFEIERRGERRFRNPGVRRRVLWRVVADGVGYLSTAARSDEQYEQRGEPGGEPGGEIVEAGAGAAVVFITIVVMTDHGIHGVDGPVGQDSGSTADNAPERRGDRRIDGVFCDRLDRCSGDLGRVELAWVSTNQTREQLASLIQVSRCADSSGDVAQHLAASGDRHGNERSRGSADSPAKDETSCEAERCSGECVGHTCCPCVSVEAPFVAEHDCAEPCDRMNAVRRLGKKLIGNKAECDGDSHRAAAIEASTRSTW